MFFTNQNETRLFFYSSWQKWQNRQPLTPLEEQIVTVITEHPEYHSFFTTPATLESNYFSELGETNPFLHLGLHLAIREQVATNRPAGIASLFQKLLKKNSNILDSEHIIMDYLAECLWVAQKEKAMPDETHYLNSLRRHIDSI